MAAGKGGDFTLRLFVVLCAVIIIWGCIEVEKVVVDTNDQIIESGVYDAAITVTMQDGTVYLIPDARIEVRVGGVEPPPPPCPYQEKLNINAATQEQFEKLPGIGPTYAERIIEYRSLHGKFSEIVELTDVRGIGPKTFGKFSHCICVEDVVWAVEEH